MKSILALSLIAGLTLSTMPAMAQTAEFDTPLKGNVANLPQQFPSASPLGGGPRDGAGKMNLSNDQLEKMYQLKNKLLDDIGPKKVELQKQKRHLKDLLTQETLDRGAIEATQSKINALKADMSNIALAFKMDLNENLTAEQRQNLRYRKMMKSKKHRGHRGRHHQNRHRRGFNQTGQPQNVIGESNFEEGAGNLAEISEAI